MINRKIWKGDLLRLSEGNAFYGRNEVVRMVPGYATAWEDSEPGDPLVEIDGGRYIVKREDLHELDRREVSIARAEATIRYAGLNEASKEEIAGAVKVLNDSNVEDTDANER